MKAILLLAATVTLAAAVFFGDSIASSVEDIAHGGGLNSCGCHIDHSTGVCHCHRAPACGC